MTLVATAAGAQTPTDGAPVVRACTYYGQMQLVVMSPSGVMAGMDEEPIVLDTPTRSSGGVVYYWGTETQPEGDASQVLSVLPAGGSGTGTRFGRQGYHPVELEGEAVQAMAFQQFGEPWTFAIDGTLYIDEEGVALPVGTVELRSCEIDGEPRRALMIRTTAGTGDWWFLSDGRVYRQRTDGRVVQVGWMEWRIASIGTEETMIVMTKGMQPADRWTGWSDGARYIDPR